MFKYIYFFLASLLYIIAIPYLLFKQRTKKYKKAIAAKFFLINNSKFKKNKIWFHTCSMGETKMIKPFVEYFGKSNINLSVITNTGFEEGKKFGVDVRYLPFEIFLPFWITKQKVLVVVEAELWYLMFLVAKFKGIKTILINARISDNSYKNYKRFKFFYKHIFKYIDKIYAQEKKDKNRLEELGGKNIEVVGNLKLLNLPKVSKKFKKPNEIIIVAASTHSGEEEILLNSWDKNFGKLIIVPRHPERFDEVYWLIKSKFQNTNIKFHRFSKQEDFKSDIVLVDKMGELNNIYAISDVVILGGSFIEGIGGHNPIEPANFNCKLISGRYIFNQKALFESIKNYYLIDKSELKQYLKGIKNLKQSKIKKSGTIDPIIEDIKRELDG